MILAVQITPLMPSYPLVDGIIIALCLLKFPPKPTIIALHSKRSQLLLGRSGTIKSIDFTFYAMVSRYQSDIVNCLNLLKNEYYHGHRT